MENNYIKINLPDTVKAYAAGYGEGVFCIVSDEAKAAYDADEEGTTYDGILDNDSIYWPGLTHGARIPFEMRGERRPVVPFEWLRDHYGRETYPEMKERHQKEVNALPMGFAFSESQYKEKLAEWGITPEEAKAGAIVGIGAGGFIRSGDLELFNSTFKRIADERQAAIDTDTDGTGFIYEMFLDELQNHEYIYTQDTTETLNALGLSMDDIRANPTLKNGLLTAIETIIDNVEKNEHSARGAGTAAGPGGEEGTDPQ